MPRVHAAYCRTREGLPDLCVLIDRRKARSSTHHCDDAIILSSFQEPHAGKDGLLAGEGYRETADYDMLNYGCFSLYLVTDNVARERNEGR